MEMHAIKQHVMENIRMNAAKVRYLRLKIKVTRIIREHTLESKK